MKTSTILPILRYFAGHNKWSKIRHKKGANDKSRAQAFAKATRAIMIQSKLCNGDESDLQLQSAISHAKSIQVPKDRILEAIAKGCTPKNNNSTNQDLIPLRFDAIVLFEATSLSSSFVKVSFVITALTEKRNRATQHIRTIIVKQGGEFLPTDTLNYIFVKAGLIMVKNVSKNNEEEALLECAVEAGAINVEEEEEEILNAEDEENNDIIDTDESLLSKSSSSFVVTTEEKDLFHVVTALRDAGFVVSQFEHSYILVDEEHGAIKLPKESEDEFYKFLEKLNDNDDVNRIYHNAIVLSL